VVAAALELAIKQPELLPHKLATGFDDQQHHLVSEARVYRLKADDLISSAAFILLQHHRT
jgi:hypothetical protein